ncbi:MAG: hypothetical protein ETSY1_41425 [Candidatus Entotheonella factor]|uniref:Uncharacterized protein n=1 Tax=Entotheonella factor TaxID=1429438 RepID=W4L4G0_ENTF1|nr:hypothetical protein [Candidatus Entotheonella palauensis]ETW92942.1 MAG: hypothetical protein ETSY1_41425 [Candidatus Entotheonella factor]
MITLSVAGALWSGIIDTGFNGDLELPEELRGQLNAQYIGRLSSLLAGGQQVDEDVYLVEFPFDGRTVRAEATFADSREILIGTQLLSSYRLEIDFPQQTVRLESTYAG